MIINSSNLVSLTKGFRGNFMNGVANAPQDHASFTTFTNSTTAEEEYPWLGEMPGMKKWVGDRVIKNLKEYGYKIRNEDFEDTVAVPRNAVLDDKYGVYATPMEALGRAAAAHPCELSYAKLKAGFTTTCYDGQLMFDTDHPVLDANGSTVSVANTDGGSGEAWFLIASGALVKPVILQGRQDNQFVARDDPNDSNVFFRKEFVYGVDARRGAGFGLWQGIWASKQPLTAANYAVARSALINMKGDHGRPLGLRPDLLLVGSSNESPGLKVVRNTLGANGESIEWEGTARLQVAAWL